MRISDWSSDVCSSDLFFRRVAGDALTARIHPIVAKATDSVGVTQKYKSFTSGSAGGELGGLLGALGGGKSDKGGSPLDLDDYVTSKTLDGLFTEIGAQEQRSEEHTSELQSLMRISYAVFCLKKTKKQ